MASIEPSSTMTSFHSLNDCASRLSIARGKNRAWLYTGISTVTRARTTGSGLRPLRRCPLRIGCLSTRAAPAYTARDRAHLFERELRCAIGVEQAVRLLVGVRELRIAEASEAAGGMDC